MFDLLIRAWSSSTALAVTLDYYFLASFLAANREELVSWSVPLNGRAFARDRKGRGFESWLVRFQVTTALDRLLTRMCLCHQAV